MTQWAEMLSNYLPNRSDACRWLLNELGHFPTILKELLLSPDETVRQAAASVADTALRRCMLAAGGGGGGGGRSQGRDSDASLGLYAAAAEEQERQEAEGLNWGQDLGEGFVAVGQGGVATDPQGDDTSLAQKTVRGALQAGMGRGLGATWDVYRHVVVFQSSKQSVVLFVHGAAWPVKRVSLLLRLSSTDVPCAIYLFRFCFVCFQSEPHPFLLREKSSTLDDVDGFIHLYIHITE